MAHYFDQTPQSESQIRTVQARIHGIDFEFSTDSGVFSRNRMDYGTELLVETVIQDQQKMNGKLVDLGCGYGPVGIIMKRAFPSLDVVLCDINSRALTLARHNARANQVAFLQILQSDALAAVEGPLNYVLTNPPIRAGKAVVHRFFSEAREKLAPGGLLYVVIQKKQGAPSALARLKELFLEAEVIEHSAGYWIIRAKA
ncbi:MAG: methyltransferase [Eubacteriales bacterium]|nr:methyltransferase [Eubacteriales bacterium]